VNVQGICGKERYVANIFRQTGEFTSAVKIVWTCLDPRQQSRHEIHIFLNLFRGTVGYITELLFCNISDLPFHFVLRCKASMCAEVKRTVRADSVVAYQNAGILNVCS
jgi:hypothetical protein